MNIGESLRLEDSTLGGTHRYAVVCGFQFIVGLEVVQETFGILFLRVQNLFWSLLNCLPQNWVSKKLDTISNLAAFRRTDKLNGGFIFTGCAKDHAVRHKVNELTGFQVGKDNNIATEHLFDGDLAIETGADKSGLTLAEINLFTVNMSAVRVRLAFKNLADAEIALRIDLPDFIKLGCFLNWSFWLALWLFGFFGLFLSTLGSSWLSLFFRLVLLGGSCSLCLGFFHFLLFNRSRLVVDSGKAVSRVELGKGRDGMLAAQISFQLENHVIEEPRRGLELLQNILCHI